MSDGGANRGESPGCQPIEYIRRMKLTVDLVTGGRAIDRPRLGSRSDEAASPGAAVLLIESREA